MSETGIKKASSLSSDQLHIKKWCDRTLVRLQEIKESSEPASLKYVRASIDIYFLLQEMAATYLTEDEQTVLRQAMELYMNLQ